MTSDPNHWSLFVCNTYLIPPAHSTAATKTCERQKDRATALGRMIHKHKPDVVLLQEMWGAGYSQLQKALAKGEPEAYDVPQDDWRGDEQRKAVDAEYKERAGRYCDQKHVTDAKNDPLHPRNMANKEALSTQRPNFVVPLMMRSWWGLELFDVLTQYFTSRGGLYHAHNKNTVALQGAYMTVPALSSLRKVGLMPQYPRLHTFSTTYFPKHRKSVIVLKATKELDKSSHATTSPSAVPLLLFNTHLDPQNLGPKHRIIERQLVELRNFIADVVEKEWEASLTTKDRPCEASTFTAPFAAIIVGDFNISAESQLFARLFEIMGKADLLAVDVEVDEKETTDAKKLIASKVTLAQKRKVSVHLESLLSATALATHTYCTNNATVQYPADEGRLDHLFVIKSVTVEVEGASSTNVRSGRHGTKDSVATVAVAKLEANRKVTINLQPVSLAYERVLNDHKGGDALVSDHYPFVAEIQVGGSK